MICSPDQLTAAWLSDVMQKRVSTVSATPIGTGQVGATYRLTLSGEDVPATLVAKLPSNDALSRATGKAHLTYLREALFYQQFAGRKAMAIPKHIYIAFDEDSHDFTLIMHDLPRHRAGNQLAEPSIAEAELAIVAAAGIHAAWWGDPRLDTLEWPNGTRAVPPAIDVDAIYAALWPGFCDRYGDRVSSDMLALGEQLVGRIAAQQSRQQSPRCLTHNDFRPDNMLFAPMADMREATTDPVVIVDWQTTGVGVGAGDYAYYLGTSFEPETRRMLDDKLRQRYRDALLSHGVEGTDLRALDDDIARCSINGFLMGVTASMVVERTERGDAMFLTMARRSASMALDDPDQSIPSRG